MSEAREEFKAGQTDGISIALGYFAVSFALGIAMANAGIHAFQGFVMSFLNLASAGEYAATQVIAADGSYFQIAVITLIANARYLLMSCAPSSHVIAARTGVFNSPIANGKPLTSSTISSRFPPSFFG